MFPLHHSPLTGAGRLEHPSSPLDWSPSPELNRHSTGYSRLSLTVGRDGVVGQEGFEPSYTQLKRLVGFLVAYTDPWRAVGELHSLLVVLQTTALLISQLPFSFQIYIPTCTLLLSVILLLFLVQTIL